MSATLLICLLGFLAIASSQQTPCADPVNVATYNVLQIPFAADRDERLDGVVSYFQNNQLDLEVLCLQELWEADDRAEVVNGLRSQYPYQFSAPRFPQGECQGGCSSDEISRLRDCIDISDCIASIFSDDEQYDCISDNCRDTFESVGAQCGSCLLSGDNFLGNIRNLDNCLSNDNAVEGDVCYAFDGQSDNLILSRVPLLDTEVLSFQNSNITYVTALYARIESAVLGNTHIVCTHLLPADLPVFTFEQPINVNQSNEILNLVNSKLNGTNQAVLLMGDFNHGPNEWPENYDALVQQGYASAYIAAGNTNCTYCISNPIASGDASFIIDHVYMRNAFQTASNRFLTYYDYNVERDGSNNRIPLSDHYGVRADICPGTTPAFTLASAVNVQDTDTFEGSNQDSSAASLVAGAALLAAALVF